MGEGQGAGEQLLRGEGEALAGVLAASELEAGK